MGEDRWHGDVSDDDHGGVMISSCRPGTETFAALIGGSRHEVLDTGGHMLLETRRETIAERVASFFSESH